MTQSLDRVGDSVEKVLSDAVVDDREAGVIRANRRIFTDEEIFELEMKHIFEGNWVYLAHESQVPEPGDYFTTYIGRQPMMITRDKDGELHCLINACAHRGAMICRSKTDNRKTLTCPFHGWTFRNDGTLLKVKDPEGAGYPESFDTDGSHNMTKVPTLRQLPRLPVRQPQRRRRCRSRSTSVTPPRSSTCSSTSRPTGLEVLRGSSTYTFDGNWKVQAENGADGYHVTATHWNYAATTSRRNTGESKNETKTLDAGSWGKSGGGYWSYPNGHLCLWTWAANPAGPAAVGADGRAEGAVRRRQGRVHGQGLPQPVPLPERLPDGPVLDADPALPPDRAGPDRGHHLLHRPEGRERRGPGLPDPPVRGLLQRLGHGHARRPGGVPLLPADLPGHRRAVERHEPRRRALAHGPDEVAQALGHDGVISAGRKNEDEGLYPVQHGYWLETMRAALETEKGA